MIFQEHTEKEEENKRVQNKEHPLLQYSSHQVETILASSI